MNNLSIKVFVFVCSLLGITGMHAQNHSRFNAGTIEYERKQNIPAAFNYHPAMQNFVEKNGSEIYLSNFTLTVSSKATLYEYSKANGPKNRFDEMPADQNIVYENFSSGNKIIQKSVLGKKYILSGDSIPPIQWKITGEKNEIAGYTCRRANGLLFDSIYIVGFFSDDFIVQSGPENFRGLPGMILGISIPKEHISWFATKVIPEKVEPEIQELKTENQFSYREFNLAVTKRLRKIPNFGEVMLKRALF